MEYTNIPEIFVITYIHVSYYGLQNIRGEFSFKDSKIVETINKSLDYIESIDVKKSRL